MSSENLWGDLSQLKFDDPTPKSILKEQAEILARETGGVLQGRVSAQLRPVDLAQRPNRELAYDFDVVVPRLNNYKYTVLSIEHGIDGYPVELNCSRPPTSVTCEDEASFEKQLGGVLGSEEVKEVLSRLVSQATTT